MGTKRIIFIALIILPLLGFSQKKRVWNKPLYDSYKFHFGFGFSLGLLDFSVAHADDWLNEDKYLDPTLDSVFSVLGQSKPIFGASMVANLKLNENFDLRFVPGLAFGQRNLEFLRSYIDERDQYQVNYHLMKIESTYLQFPLLLKYRAVRESNYRPYIIGGVNYTLDLATRKKVKEEEQPKIRLTKHDVLLEIGAGIDYYLPYFKYSTELKFSYGLLNIVDQNIDPNSPEDIAAQPYSDMFRRLGTKMVTLVIYFE